MVAAKHTSSSNKSADPHRLYFNPQPHFLTVSDNLRTTYSFDGEGRLLGAFLDGVNYRRGLGGDILMKQVVGGRTKRRRMLSTFERRQLLSVVSAHVAAIRECAQSVASPEVCAWLDRALTWDVERLEAERDAFQEIYKPISILPPDQYLALVLQAAEGCSWNRCTFCSLYRDRKFRIKTPEEFRRHVRSVKAFVGAGLRMRKSIFLGDANALIIPQARLGELLAVVHQEFVIGDKGLKGIYAFLDIFGAERKTVSDYRELRDAGVRRIYLGLESGDETVFRLLNKPGSPSACIEAVQAIKAAGLNVGIILLAGAGGARLAPAHVNHSLEALAAMGLSEGDLVYISPLIVSPTGPYAEQLDQAGSPWLDHAAINAQLTYLKDGARALCDPRAKVALYHIEEFIY
ncbi:MAG: radical SAM protein [Oscillochloridaceae bacterium]|nr:radical SAM protein [Chloroflexaceae bacterium]MDW8389652.1 radical SAM protein [Oscillochloridaceae bacterium]